jgi:ribosomal protein uS19
MDESEMERAAALRKKRTFRKFMFRGIELEKLLDLNHEEFAKLIHARARRRIYRGLKSKPKRFIARLRKAKKNCGPMDKPEPVKTHLRDRTVFYSIEQLFVCIFPNNTSRLYLLLLYIPLSPQGIC